MFGLGILVTLAVIALAVAYRPSTSEVSDAPPTHQITRSNFVRQVLASGKIESLNQVEVGAQVSGQIKELRVALGQEVVKGDLLAVIDPTLAQNDMQAAAAALDSVRAQIGGARAQLALSEEVLSRQRALAKIDASARQDVETAYVQYETAKSTLGSIESQIRSSRIGVDNQLAKLAQTRILAPMNGQVVSIIAKQGQTVIAAQQVPVILRLANLSQVVVRAEVSEADVARVRVGHAVTFSVLGDSARTYSSTVDTIDPVPSGSTDAAGSGMSGPVFYNVLLKAPNREGKLRLGMTVRVSILTDRADAVLQVPVAALGPENPDGTYGVRVLTSPPGTQPIQSTVRAVRVGRGNNEMYEVLSGLEEGDLVALRLPVGASKQSTSAQSLSFLLP